MAGFTEGKDVVTGPINTASGTVTTAAEAVQYHIQNKGTYLTKTNKVRCILKSFSCGNDTNGVATFTIYRNSTLSGAPTYADVNGDDSVMQVATDTTITTPGKVLFKGLVSQTGGNIFDLEHLSIKVSPNDVITITASTAGNSGLMLSTLIWQEDF